MDGDVNGSEVERVVVVGLDAADASLLIDGIDDGRYPTLAHLRDVGSWGLVESPSGFGSGAVWPSFATGVSPATHGRYYYQQVQPGSYEAMPFRAEQFAAKPMWEQVSDGGRSVAVVDVPKMGLSTDIDGEMVVDWMVHGPVYHETRTFPASYRADLVGEFGADQMPRCDSSGGRTSAEHRELIEILQDRIRRRTAMTTDLLDRRPRDLVLTVFGDSHCIGHQAWHIRDEQHPLHDADTFREIGDPIDQVYGSIDESIGRILEHVDSDTTFVVFAGTGMGPNYSGNHLLDDVLRRLEGVTETSSATLVRRLKLFAKRIVPGVLRDRAQRMKRRVEEKTSVGDRARRRAFAVPHNEIAGAVRLNIVGRERDGLVDPGDVDAYVERLTQSLLALRNVETGDPVVARVSLVRNESHGDRLDHLPDLFVVWNRSHAINGVTSDEVGEIRKADSKSRTGDHSPDSAFFAIGPRVRPGRVDGTSIYDFAPSILALLGVEPHRSDGKIIDGLVGGDGVTAETTAARHSPDGS